MPAKGTAAARSVSKTVAANAAAKLLASLNSMKPRRPKRSAFDCGERQESDAARALDRGGQQALMPGARAGDPAGRDLPAFGHEARQQPDVLVIDAHRLVGAEATDLAPH